MRTVLHLLKLLYWGFVNRSGRFEFFSTLLRNVPEEFGIELRRLLLKRYFKKCGDGLRCHAGARFRCVHGISVGDNVRIGVGAFLQGDGGITLGNDVVLGPAAKIWSVNHQFADPDIPVRLQGYERAAVKIGDDVWIGANAFVMPGAQIGRGCIISAGSVVGGKTIPDYSILSGNPARMIGRRQRSSQAAVAE